MAKKPIRIQKTQRVTTRRFAATTERAPAEIKLVKKQDTATRYEDLLNSIYDAVVISTLDGQIVDVNDRAQQFFRFSGEEMVEMNVTRLIARAGSSLLKTLQRNVESQKYTVIHANCVRKNRSHFSSDVAVSLIPLGDTQGLFFSFRDVSKRKQAEEELNTEHNAIMNASTGIVITDNEGRIQYANPAFYELAGYEDSGIAITEVSQFWASPEEFDEVNNVVKEGNSCGGEMLARTKSGDTIHVDASVAPNRNSQGEQEGLVCSFSDISERKNTELALAAANEELLTSAKDKSRLDTVSTLAYEINNPLQILLSMVEMDQKDEYRKQVERILEVISKMQQGDILEQTPAESSRPPTEFTPPAAAPATSLTPCNKDCILIVDDEVSLRTIFGQLIETFLPDINVSYAENGKEAVQQFIAIKPAVIIMDLAMPEMNGEDAHHTIEEYCADNNTQLPSVVFCTGFVPSQFVSGLVETNDLHTILTKPIGKNDLIGAIEERFAHRHFV